MTLLLRLKSAIVSRSRGKPLGKDHPELLFNLKSSHGHDMAIVNGIGRIGYMKGGGKAFVER